MKYSVLSEWNLDNNHGSNCKDFNNVFDAKDYFLQERSKALRLNLEKVEEKEEEDDIVTYDAKNSYHVHLNYIKEE